MADLLSDFKTLEEILGTGNVNVSSTGKGVDVGSNVTWEGGGGFAEEIAENPYLRNLSPGNNNGSQGGGLFSDSGISNIALGVISNNPIQIIQGIMGLGGNLEAPTTQDVEDQLRKAREAEGKTIRRPDVLPPGYVKDSGGFVRSTDPTDNGYYRYSKGKIEATTPPLNPIEKPTKSGGGGGNSGAPATATSPWLYPNETVISPDATIVDVHTNPDGSTVNVFSDGSERWNEAPTTFEGWPTEQVEVADETDDLFIPDIALPRLGEEEVTESVNASGEGNGDGEGEGAGNGSGNATGSGLTGLVSGLLAATPDEITKTVFDTDLAEIGAEYTLLGNLLQRGYA